MNVQLIIVVLLFAGAVFYVGRMVYKSLTAKSGCGTTASAGWIFQKLNHLKLINSILSEFKPIIFFY